MKAHQNVEICQKFAQTTGILNFIFGILELGNCNSKIPNSKIPNSNFPIPKFKFLQMHQFPSRYDTFSLVVSTIVITISLIPITIVAGTTNAPEWAYNALPMPLFVIIAFGIHPQSFTLTPDTLIINRPFGKIRFPVSEIKEVRQITTSDIGHSMKLFASSGLFGYSGLYTSRKIGKYTMWCRNLESLVMIVFENKTIILSPDDPEGFVYRVRNYMS